MKLEAEHLAFSYGKRQVLKDISLTLDQGQVLCVLGPNGVGKSTLFRCILGLQRGYHGSVRLDGREVSTMKPKELAHCIAYIPQFSGSVFQYSVLHTVLMGTTSQLNTMANPGEAQEKAAMNALERLGIAHLKDRQADTLSGGERQLVLIARALAQNSPLLLMDEPTASLDYGNAVRVMEMVSSLAEQGYGIILSTHEPDQAMSWGTQALVVQEGRVAAFGTPEEAITEDLLSQVYGVPIRIESLMVDGDPHRVCVPLRYPNKK